jgi:hypothetical protein
MNKKPFAKRASRLILFCLLLVPLLISSPKQRVKADVDYSCENLYSFCVYNCAVATGGWDPEYTACRQQCEVMYMSCSTCDSFGEPPDCEDVDIPEPYPVWADWTQCMDSCQACNSLPMIDRSACFVPCKANCLALYTN